MVRIQKDRSLFSCFVLLIEYWVYLVKFFRPNQVFSMRHWRTAHFIHQLQGFVPFPFRSEWARCKSRKLRRRQPTECWKRNRTVVPNRWSKLASILEMGWASIQIYPKVCRESFVAGSHMHAFFGCPTAFTFQQGDPKIFMRFAAEVVRNHHWQVKQWFQKLIHLSSCAKKLSGWISPALASTEERNGSSESSRL